MQDLYTLLDKSLAQLGYELVDMEMSNRGKLIRLFIDKPEGINIDDCVLVSNHLSDLLAVEHDIDYDRLEVSSPGLDRILKKETDYVRFAGERAQVKVRIPVEGRKNFLGILRGLDQGNLVIECDGVEQRIALSNIDKARLSPEY
ncbi:ribosome maturation factor RimP [Methylobacillus caricis]|uniref:ribosome maturation factor RimP n=1 Tax=Methylobacillus caricis TaxID=1971611 RepID=UPI001CFFA5A9|nr:ribosome maturation factor RimP [Methylobacillus caricis]MCB5188189.1 ribosome maturation factor RimP [Methylobacillus caricis]